MASNGQLGLPCPRFPQWRHVYFGHSDVVWLLLPHSQQPPSESSLLLPLLLKLGVLQVVLFVPEWLFSSSSLLLSCLF